ncbi:MAG: TetR/AcrR family transcriptional regulator [Polyangiaceae bacterium]|nr:TetR/AcrR family transcriptional regulator [Polyangiaceae bacterium]
MARPREFDEDEVLDRALELFFRKGYEATSVQDLVEATGLARASLYGAFGDKQALYIRLLDRYLSKTPPLDALLDENLPPREALAGLLRAWVQATCPSKGPRGCFLQLAVNQQDDVPFARQRLEERSRHLQARLESFLAAAQRRGEIGSERSPEALAHLLLVFQQGVAASARSGPCTPRLTEAAEALLTLIFSPAPAASSPQGRRKQQV